MIKYNVMIIGAGQLGLLLVESSTKLLDYINKIYIYTDKEENCCRYLNYNYIEVIVGNYDDINKINYICNICDYITYEFESFPLTIFTEYNRQKIYPCIDVLQIIQDKYKQKNFMFKNNVKIPNLSIVNSYNDIISFINLYKYPVFLKIRKGSFDGRGNHLIKNEADLEEFTNIEPNIYYIEEYIDFDKEVSIMGCKNSKKEFVYYDIVENKHKNSILVETIFPDKNLDETTKNKIIGIFSRIIDLFNTRGIICIEFFIKDTIVYYNECCLRVHNSGHYTINSSYTSQFENHLRSVMNLNLGYTKNVFSGQFYNIISGLQTEEDLEKILDYKKNKHYIKHYNKKSSGIRKIGHLVIPNTSI